MSHVAFLFVAVLLLVATFLLVATLLLVAISARDVTTHGFPVCGGALAWGDTTVRALVVTGHAVFEDGF